MHAPRLIAIHPRFTRVWPLVGDALERCWQQQGPVDVLRLESDDDRPLGQFVPRDNAYEHVAALGVTVTPACLNALPALREIAPLNPYASAHADDPELATALRDRNIQPRHHTTEAFWGQSVAEFGLAITLAALRRIPQTYRQMIDDPTVWDYDPGSTHDVAGLRGQQFGDDPRFTSGTLAGKRVRIIGAGNIAGRYARFCSTFGADVAAWDPFAPEITFELAGARRVPRMEDLLHDAEIFVPMVPHTCQTEGMVKAEHIDALPVGCLVVCVTRMQIVDAEALKRRVLSDELALAADVFDKEPVPLDSPLLARHNVVHTPHNAGRTRHANEQFADLLARAFSPLNNHQPTGEPAAAQTAGH